VRFVPRDRRGRVYTVTDAQRPKSEDIAYRQRRYLISMGIRVVAFLLAVFLFHGVWRFVAAGVALVVPYFAVVFANGGREPESGKFEPFDPNSLPAGGQPGDEADQGSPPRPASNGHTDRPGTHPFDPHTDPTPPLRRDP
jgi:Protein of unknown function (DUF3099)